MFWPEAPQRPASQRLVQSAVFSPAVPPNRPAGQSSGVMDRWGQYDETGHSTITAGVLQKEPAGQGVVPIVEPSGHVVPTIHEILSEAGVSQEEPAAQGASAVEPAGQNEP